MIDKKTRRFSMNRFFSFFLFIASSYFLIQGCAFNVETKVSQAMDIMSDYEEKLAGKYAVLISDELQDFSQEAKWTGMICSFHSYPIKMEDKLKTAIMDTLENVFEEVEETKIKTISSASDFSAVIKIRLDHFDSNMTCSQGFFTPSCTSNTEFAIKVTVTSQGRKLLNTRISASRSAHGDGGMFCEGVANPISKSVDITIREVMERLAERLLNSGKIRTSLQTTKPPFTTSNIDSQEQQPKNPLEKQIFGTGFMFGSKDYVITNWHVIRGTKNIKVKFLNGEKINAEVLLKDAQNDIAFLKLERSPQISPSDLKLGDSADIKMGDKVFTVGYPAHWVMGEKPKYTEGVVNALSGINDDPTVFQISVQIQPGNSGGPLFNKRGEVIGITQSSLDPLLATKSFGALPQNVNYAIKSSYISNLLPMLPETLIASRGISVVPTEPENSLPNFIDRAKNNIVLIQATLK